jgi:calcineurin-like phosphoesterase family protein
MIVLAIWFTSDWHFNHNKDFIYAARGFEDVQDMNTTIVARHNLFVKPEDDVYVLGDLCMGEDLAVNKVLIESLNGNLHVILGNHDGNKRHTMYCDCKNIVEICGLAKTLKYRKYTFYLSHYPAMTANFDDDKPLRQKVINLAGHTHDTSAISLIEQNNMLSYNVGVDAHDCYPVELDKIISYLKGEKE